MPQLMMNYCMPGILLTSTSLRGMRETTLIENSVTLETKSEVIVTNLIPTMILQISVVVVTSTKTINPCINTCLIAGVFYSLGCLSPNSIWILLWQDLHRDMRLLSASVPSLLTNKMWCTSSTGVILLSSKQCSQRGCFLTSAYQRPLSRSLLFIINLPDDEVRIASGKCFHPSP